VSNKDLLVILNPRQATDCVQSLSALKVPKVWITNFNERDALQRVMEIVRCEPPAKAKWLQERDASGSLHAGTSFGPPPKFENYIMISDDVIVEQRHIDVIVDNNDNYDVLSGYCNLTPDTTITNLVPAAWGEKLTLTGITGKSKSKHSSPAPAKHDYPFYESDRHKYENVIKEITDDIFETYSIGFSFTSFKREVLLKYGLATYHDKQFGGASDHHISYRIVNDGIYKMYAHRDCYFEHLKLKRMPLCRGIAKITWEI